MLAGGTTRDASARLRTGCWSTAGGGILRVLPWCPHSEADSTRLLYPAHLRCAAQLGRYDVLVLIAFDLETSRRPRVVVLPTSCLGRCNRRLEDSLTYTQREVDIGFNAVRAKCATVAGAHVVEPIRLQHRANTELNASTDERHALVYPGSRHAALPCTWNHRVGSHSMFHPLSQHPGTALFANKVISGYLWKWVVGNARNF